MKKILPVFLCALMLVSLFAVPAYAAAVKDLTAAYGKPTIDGKVDDIWSSTKEYTPAVVLKDEGGDANGTIRYLWDEDTLYVLAVVKDDQLFTSNGDAWQNDCVEFFISDKNNKGGSYAAGDKQIRVNAAGTVTEDNRSCKTAVEVTDDGYVIEIGIPFVEIKGAADTVIGVDAQIADCDGGSATNRLVTLCDDVTNGQQYQNNSGFGNLTLLAAAAADDGKKEEPAAGGTSPVDSSVKGNKEGNPSTGDNVFVLFAAAALLASAAALGVMLKKQKV